MNKSYNMNIDTGEKTWLTPPELAKAYCDLKICRMLHGSILMK